MENLKLTNLSLPNLYVSFHDVVTKTLFLLTCLHIFPSSLLVASLAAPIQEIKKYLIYYKIQYTGRFLLPFQELEQFSEMRLFYSPAEISSRLQEKQAQQVKEN